MLRSPWWCLALTGPLIDALGKREGWAVITGDTSDVERTQVQDDFQAGKLKGVACTIKAGGVAITLTRATNEIFIDEEWTPALNAQAQDRCHRIGQTGNVQITRLVATHALDRRIAELLGEKTTRINATIEAAAVRNGEVVGSELVGEIDIEKLAVAAATIAAAEQVMTNAVSATVVAAEVVAADIEIDVTGECPF